MPAVFNVIGGFAPYQATERLGYHSGSILFLQGEKIYIKKTSLSKLVGALLIVVGAFLLYQLWAPKQDPWLAVLMASPAAPAILSRVVVFAQNGSAE
jgi:hypothetical protein